MRKLVSICTALAALCLIIGCATTDLDTDEKRYVAARAELNLLLESYIGMQDEISDADHENIRTAFFSADAALDLWESNLNSGLDWTENYRAWMEAKSVILQIVKEVI